MRIVLSLAALGLAAGGATAVATQSSCSSTSNVCSAASCAPTACESGVQVAACVAAPQQDRMSKRAAELEALAGGAEEPARVDLELAPSAPAQTGGLRRAFKYENGKLTALDSGAAPSPTSAVQDHVQCDGRGTCESTGPVACSGQSGCSGQSACGGAGASAGATTCAPTAPRAAQKRGALEATQPAEGQRKAKAKTKRDVTIAVPPSSADGPARATRTLESRLAEARRTQERALEDARRQLQSAQREAERARRAAESQSRRAMEQAREQLARVQRDDLAQVREHVERAMGDAREAQLKALADAERAIAVQRGHARSRTTAPAVPAAPFGAASPAVPSAPRAPAGASQRERELEARVAELEARLEQVEGRARGQAGSPAAPGNVLVAPNGAHRQSWTWHDAPGGATVEVHTWNDEDADCNPTRTHVLQLENGAVALIDEDQWEELSDTFEELGQDWEDAFEDLGDDWEDELEDANEAIEDAFEDLEDAADDLDDESEESDQSPIDVAPAPEVASGELSNASGDPFYLGRGAVLGGLTPVDRTIYSGAQVAPLMLRAATGFTPSPELELRGVVTQMRSEVEALRATLRDLRREVEARKSELR